MAWTITRKVELGKTGLKVHPIGLGANKITAENPETNTEYGGEILKAAIENGLLHCFPEAVSL